MVGKAIAKAISKQIAENWSTGQKRSVQVSRTDSNLEPETVSEMEKIIFNKKDIDEYKNNFEDKTFKRSNEVEKKGIKELSKNIEVDEDTDVVKNTLSDMKKFKKAVEEQHPYSYIETTPRVPSYEQQVGALPSGQVEGGKLRIYNTDEDVANMGKTFRGLVGLNVKIADGVTVGSRFDIRAYENFAEFISTLHAPQSAGKVIGYARTAIIENADLSMRRERKKNLTSANISKGFKIDRKGKEVPVAKSPFVKMEGQWRNHDSLQLREDVDAFLKGTKSDLLGGTNWVRVSVNPSKGATFVQVKPNKRLINSKKRVEGKTPTISAPLVGASRIIQIGKLVLAENPKLFNEQVVRKKADEIITRLRGRNIDIDEEEIIANLTWKEYYKAGNFNEGGDVKDQTQRMLKKKIDGLDKPAMQEGGLLQEGGTTDPVSGNDVPVGSTQEEVRDDIPAQLSEGEFVFPADVVRFIGLDNLMKLRQEAKAGLAKMDRMGQMGNSEEAVEDDTGEFDTDIDDIIGEIEREARMAQPQEEKAEEETPVKKSDEERLGFNIGGLGTKDDSSENKQTVGKNMAMVYEKDNVPDSVQKLFDANPEVKDKIKGTVSGFFNKKDTKAKTTPTATPALPQSTQSNLLDPLDPKQMERAFGSFALTRGAVEAAEKKYPNLARKNRQVSTSKGSTQTSKDSTQMLSYVSGPENYQDLDIAGAESNIYSQLQNQNNFLKSQGYNYPHQKDLKFIHTHMAKDLANAGIKDIRQLGYKEEDVIGTASVIKKGDKYYVNEPTGEWKAQAPQYKLREVDVVGDVKTRTVRTPTGHGTYSTRTYTTAKAKIGTTRTLINKDTGEKVVQGKYHGNLGYGKQSDDPREGLRWGNTTRVEGMADYMIAFDANDQAIIYPKYEDTASGFVKPLLMGAALATTFVAPGVGASIGKAVGLSGKLATTFGNAMIGGTLSKAGGGDFFKGALLASIPSVVSEIVPTSTIDNISKTTNISTKTITSGFEKSVSHGLRNIAEGKSFTDGIDKILLSEGIQGEVVPKIKSFVDNKFTPDVVDSIKNKTFAAAEDFYKKGNKA